jgi:hypothetical protein
LSQNSVKMRKQFLINFILNYTIIYSLAEEQCLISFVFSDLQNEIAINLALIYLKDINYEKIFFFKSC